MSSIVLGILLFLVVGSGNNFPSMIKPKHVYADPTAPANTAVLTYKGDNQRTGQYKHEEILNTSNVNKSQFGKRVTYPVDGQMYAQPLYMPHLSIYGATHNVVFVATEHDSIYAFDADRTSTASALWHTSFLKNGATSVPSTSVSCNDLVPEIGITGTPVIDSQTNTMYVVVYTLENGNTIYRLHALDVTSGAEKSGSPVIIQASVTGKGSGSSNGIVTFNPLKERQRSALLLANGQIYIAFGSFCDNSPYHGWILSYTYNGSSLQQAHVYNDTVNGSGAGIWSNGNISTDNSGNIYFISGNGTFNLNTGGTEAGDVFGKLSPQLQLLDYFTPFNQSCMQLSDIDLGSGGPLVIPSANITIGGGKEGRIYVVNNSNMGKFTADPDLNCSTSERLRTDIDKVVQEFPPSTVGGLYSSTPAYWSDSSNHQYVYFAGNGDQAKAYQLSNGKLSNNPITQTPERFDFPGGNPGISSDGTSNGILWIIDSHAVLRAYDATNLGTELYNSGQNSSRDALDSYVKFATPTIADGKVFVETSQSLSIYGLLPPPGGTPTPTPSPTPKPTPTPTPGATYNNVGITSDSDPSAGNFDNKNHSYSSEALQTVGLNAGDNVFYNGMVFTWPAAAAGTPDNYVASGQTIPVIPLSNATLLGFLGAANGGPASGTAMIHYTDGSEQAFTLGFSDWTLGGGTQKPSFGNGIKATMSYRNSSSGQQVGNVYVFYTDIFLQVGKTVKSVTLPNPTGQATLHVFSIATKQGAVTPTPPPYNNIGTSDDGHPGLGNFDGNNSYSAQALQTVGITPDSEIDFNGVAFTWPDVSAGKPNNYTALGQLLPVTPVDDATKLAFLGASTGGASSGLATITYTDGSSQIFTLGLSDWTLENGTVQPSFGNQVVATTTYRNTPQGQQPAIPTIFYTDVALKTGKKIQNVILPMNNQMHIFAVATK
jgi:hypothetical protein